MADDRTQQATPHRRDKARREGDVLVSRELTAAAGTLAGVLALGTAATQFVRAWQTGLTGFLRLGAPQAWEQARLAPTLTAARGLALAILSPVAAVMAATAVAALALATLQAGGLNVHLPAIAPRWERINPVSNLSNLFSLRAAARLGKSLIPAAVLGIFATQRIAAELHMPAFSLVRLDALGGEIYGLALSAAWLLFGWAAIDYIVEWRSRESRLRMSAEELRQEMRETEGNPQIRSRIRGLQRQMRRRRVKADVARAAVVVTNPTHYAVALGFDFARMDTPKVLAKGRNLLAEEIKAEARWAGVPLVENPPLARSLYRSVEVGRAIPVDLYAAVASILAFLYRQRVEDEARARRTQQAAPSGFPGGAR